MLKDTDVKNVEDSSETTYSLVQPGPGKSVIDKIEANKILNATEVAARRTKLLSKPFQINLELTGVCNINPPCLFCSGKNFGYNYKALDPAYLDKYQDFLESCQQINEDSFGEPLSHRYMVELAQKVTGRGQIFSFVTNGLLLTPKKAEGLASCGPWLGMQISFNAATPETYYKLTGKRFDLLVQNTRHYVETYRSLNQNQSPNLTLTFIVMKINKHEVMDFLRLAHQLGARALLATLHNRPSVPLANFGYDFVYSDEMLPYEDYLAIGKAATELAEKLGLVCIVAWDSQRDYALRSFAEPGVSPTEEHDAAGGLSERATPEQLLTDVACVSPTSGVSPAEEQSATGGLAEAAPRQQPTIPCLIPWRFLFIQEHSQAVFACSYHTRPFGNVAEQSLEQIWNGNAAQELRQSLASGKIPQFCWNHSASCPLIFEARHEGIARDIETSVSMGENDYWHVDEGWYPLEYIPDKVRWTEASAWFKIRSSPGNQLFVDTLVCKPGIEDEPTCGRVEVDGVVVGIFCITDATWTTLKFDLRDNGSGEVLRGRIIVDNPYCPAKINGDVRNLGIAVRRLWTE